MPSNKRDTSRIQEKLEYSNNRNIRDQAIMVEQRKESGQTAMALGRPPMPGLLDDMKLQKTTKPIFKETEDMKESEWYERSHSKERIDVRKSHFQEARQELERNLIGTSSHDRPTMAAHEIPKAPPMPPKHHKAYVQRKPEPYTSESMTKRLRGQYVEEGDTLVFLNGLRESKGLPRLMKAAVVDSFNEQNPSDALVLSDRYVLPPRMEVDAEEVMIQVEYCGMDMEDQKRASGLLSSAKLPFVPGRDGVGKIVRMGSEVQKLFGFNLGDTVMGISSGSNWGTYGQYSVMKASHICLCPPSLPAEKAALLPMSVLLAFDAFHKVSKRIDSIKRLLILDNGHSAGVSSMLVLLAKFYFMIERVMIACPSSNIAHYKGLGADMCIDLDKETFEDVVMQYYEEEVRTIHGEPHQMQQPAVEQTAHQESVTGKKKEGAVDMVIDTIGATDTQPRAYKLLSKKGTFVAMAFPRDIERSELNARMRGGERFGMGKHMLKHKFKSYFGGTPKYEQVMIPDYDGRRLKSMADFLIDKQLLDKIPCKEYSWEQLPEAMNTLDTTPYEGRIIVNMPSH